MACRSRRGGCIIERTISPPWRKVAALGALLVVLLCWGLTPVGLRYLVGQVRPLDLLLLRYPVALIALSPWLVRIRPWRWPPRDIARLAVCGVTGSIGYTTLVAFGAQWITAGTAALLLASVPVWILVMSAAVARALPRPLALVGIAVAIFGIHVLFGGADFDAGERAFEGELLVLAGAALWGVYTVAFGPLGRRYGAFAVTPAVTLIGLLGLLPFAGASTIAAMASLDLRGWGVLIYMGAGVSGIAMIAWNFAVTELGGPRAGLVLYLTPLMGVVGGWLLLGESPGGGALAGGALILGGIALAEIGARRRTKH